MNSYWVCVGNFSGQYMRQDTRFQYSHMYQNQMVPSIKQEYLWSDCSESSLNDSWSSEYRGGISMGVSRSLQSSPTDLSFPQSDVKPSNFPAMVGYSGKQCNSRWIAVTIICGKQPELCKCFIFLEEIFWDICFPLLSTYILFSFFLWYC